MKMKKCKVCGDEPVSKYIWVERDWRNIMICKTGCKKCKIFYDSKEEWNNTMR